MTSERLSAAEETLLRKAIALAADAVLVGELPYGSLLAGADGQVLAGDRNTVSSENDITAHPELKLARWAAAHLPPDARAAVTMYTSCEPCVMCANAIARAGLGRVVFALSTAQLHERQPVDLPAPDSAPVRYQGPALIEEAGAPILAFYGAP